MESEGKPTNPLAWNTLPNQLTILRMIAVPLVIVLLNQKEFLYDIWATVVFVLAAITDYLDGYLARISKTVTISGKLLDPLADKFLVITALIMLQHLDRISPWLVMILVCREVAISGLRTLASSRGVVIAADNFGKWKTATQMVALPLLIMHIVIFDFLDCHLVGWVLAWISVAISIFSLIRYVWNFFRLLRQNK